MGIIYSVSMNKGGVGKTSLVTNMACVFAEMGHRTLIVDTDAQGNAAMTFGLNPDNIEDTTYDLMVGQKAAKDLVMNLGKNLDIIPANHDLNFIDFDIIGNIKEYPHPFMLLRKGLDAIKDQYDLIVVDTPPALSLMAGNVLAVADRVLIPFLPEVYSVKGLVRVIDTIEQFKEKHNPTLSLSGVVGMKVESHTNLHTDVMKQARQYCISNDITFFDTVIPKAVRFGETPFYEQQPTMWSKDPKSKKLAPHFIELAKEVLERG